MFQVLHDVTRSLGKKGVQYNNPADSHIVIDAVDGDFHLASKTISLLIFWNLVIRCIY